MNKILGVLTTLVVATAVALWLWLATDYGETVPATLPETKPTAAESAPAAKAAFSADAYQQAADESETEIVMGIEVLKDRNCTVQKHMVHLGDGLVTEAYSCDPPEVEEPFAAYSDADLLVMSYSDAAAAEQLGKRLLFQDEEGPANEMMLRAVALEPDDISPLQYLVTQTGSLRGNSREARKAVGNAYIISKTASYFDPSVNTKWLREDLVEYRFSSEDIDRLNRIVDGNLQRMRAVQIEVFGESRIGEAL